MCSGAAAAGRAAGTAIGPPLLLWLALLGAVQSSPVADPESVQPTADQVLRRVSDWLDTLDADQRQRQRQHQQTLGSIQEQMDRMALELERLETKMDLKIDRLQEVLIGRDISEKETSQRLTAQLERIDTQLQGNQDRTVQKVTAVHDQIKIFQAFLLSDLKVIQHMIREDPAISGTSDAWTSDVTPELRRLADGVEQLLRNRGCADTHSAGDGAEQHAPTGWHQQDTDTPQIREAPGGDQRHAATDGDHQEAGGTQPQEFPGGGERRTAADGEPRTTGDNGRRTSAGSAPLDRGGSVQQSSRSHGAHQVDSFNPFMKLLEAIEQLEQNIITSDQFETSFNWLDKQVSHRFRALKSELAQMASSIRGQFFKRRNHLEEVAGNLVALLTAAEAADRQRSGPERGGQAGVPLQTVIAVLEATIYDVIDADLWYTLPAMLEEAVGGQRNLTGQVARIEKDVHQGFSKLYAQLTALSRQLKPAGTAPPPRHEDGPVAQVEDMFAQISQQLQSLQLKLADQSTS